MINDQTCTNFSKFVGFRGNGIFREVSFQPIFTPRLKNDAQTKLSLEEERNLLRQVLCGAKNKQVAHLFLLCCCDKKRDNNSSESLIGGADVRRKCEQTIEIIELENSYLEMRARENHRDHRI